MEAIKKMRWGSEDSWIATLANLLPFWLLSVVMMSEGFPKPLLSREVAAPIFVLAIVISLILLWMGWLEFDILFYSCLPILLMFEFDEISTTYKSPFLLLCGIILSAGMIGAKRSNSVTLRWLILLSVAIATLVLASHAAQNYWHMAGDFCGACFPDGQGDPPLTGHETPWWVLFFSP